MFFILSKILSIFSSPINLVFLIFIIGIFQFKKHKKLKYIKISLYLFLFISNGFISNIALRFFEAKPIPFKEVKHHNYGIMLSGITRQNSALEDRISYTQGINRLYHTFNLYQQKKIDKIIVTGGNASIIGNNKPEADQLAQTLIEWGVPSRNIIIENEAQNTYQNAIKSVKLIPKNSTAIIITSAFHMYRSKKCFEKTGATFDTFPTDYYNTKDYYTPQNLLFPSISALKRWNIITHELLGLVSYKIAGYI